MVPFKLSDIMMAKQDDYFSINATAICGCKMTSANCGNNNIMSTGTQTAAQCGANHLAKQSATYASNSK